MLITGARGDRERREDSPDTLVTCGTNSNCQCVSEYSECDRRGAVRNIQGNKDI